MNDEKGCTEQLLPLFLFSRRQIYQTVQSSQSSSHLRLVTVQIADRRTAHLPYSNQYTDVYQVGFVVIWRTVFFFVLKMPCN